MIKLIGIVILSALLIGSASGATITVDDSGGADYTRIQDAVNAASNGDIILVRDGTYTENVDINKRLTIKSENGSANTIVYAADTNNNVFYIQSDYVNMSGFTVKGNTATSGFPGGIRLDYVDYSVIANNKISNNTYGINIWYANNNVISNNIISNNTYDGIRLVNSDYNTITNNTANLGLDGVILQGSDYNNITNNTANSHNNFGIYLHSSSNNNTILKNTANSNGGDGILVLGSSNNTVSNNIANSNFFGIELRLSSYYNTISNNIANSNNLDGIFLWSSDNNTITNNTVNSNIRYGTHLDTSSSNTIYNNYFNNTNNFGFSGTISSNTWNTTKHVGTNIIGGPYLGGNFWANPSATGFSQTCTDADRDGICDSAYVLDANNTDYLPLAYNIGTSANSIGYSATVATGQNTYVQSSNGTFSLLLKGQSKTINNSVILNNTGDISAKVEAHFNDSIGDVFGLVSGANVLNATNFALGIPSALVPLNNSGANVQVAVAPLGVTALDARLGVPSDAVAGDYSGTVVLTFSNNV